MIDITAILAMDSTRLIGAKDGLPWHTPEDMKRFRDLTTGHTVVMGRNTYFSLPERFRPLPGRRNIVITRTEIPDVEIYTSIEDFLEKVMVGNVGKVYIIGGATLYNAFFQRGLIHSVELTLVDGTHEGDVYIDEFRDDFTLVHSEKFSQGEFQTFIHH